MARSVRAFHSRSWKHFKGKNGSREKKGKKNEQGVKDNPVHATLLQPLTQEVDGEKNGTLRDTGGVTWKINWIIEDKQAERQGVGTLGEASVSRENAILPKENLPTGVSDTNTDGKESRTQYLKVMTGLPK